MTKPEVQRKFQIGDRVYKLNSNGTLNYKKAYYPARRYGMITNYIPKRNRRQAIMHYWEVKFDDSPRPSQHGQHMLTLVSPVPLDSPIS